MTSTISRLIAALLLFVGVAMFSPTRSGETFHTCTGFIDSVPATISTQGVWCLRRHLSTNITSGNAITIATNNVTIDCNDFRIGGLAAGNGSLASGIYAYNRQNATVRNCSIRGFYLGMDISFGAGHLIEDNRLDNNLYVGMHVLGENNRVRRNAVYDTGGGTGRSSTFGIYAYADIIDNKVSGLFADTAGGTLYGVYATASGTLIRDNIISGFDMTATQGGSVYNAYGIYLSAPLQRASGNQVVGGNAGSISGFGINASSSNYCIGNTVGRFATNIHASCQSSQNLTLP